jgi:hypothetical protein
MRKEILETSAVSQTIVNATRCANTCCKTILLAEFTNTFTNEVNADIISINAGETFSIGSILETGEDLIALSDGCKFKSIITREAMAVTFIVSHTERIN